MNNYNPFTCDFSTTEKSAKKMSTMQLNYAISDCLECIQLGINPSKYFDQIAIYRKELSKRKGR